MSFSGTKPLALDLFCGAGGVSMGLHRAGFDVVGVDINPQPNYPFEFIRANAMELDIDDRYSFVWASPPCQAYVRGGLVNKTGKPRLIGPVRERLERSSVKHWAIENVEGAPLRIDAKLCGSMFGLELKRHRIFESSFFLPLIPQCDHSGPIAGVYGHPHGRRGAWPGMLPGTLEQWSKSMGIDWMTARELTQAIPPAYAEWIGQAAINEISK